MEGIIESVVKFPNQMVKSRYLRMPGLNLMPENESDLAGMHFVRRWKHLFDKPVENPLGKGANKVQVDCTARL